MSVYDPTMRRQGTTPLYGRPLDDFGTIEFHSTAREWRSAGKPPGTSDPVLCYQEDGAFSVGYFANGIWFTEDGSDAFEHGHKPSPATHWMPLPPPPVTPNLPSAESQRGSFGLCPFCGAQEPTLALLSRRWQQMTEEAAREAWNRRRIEDKL